MDLFILRHGEAGRSSATVRDDSKRTLSVEGEKEVKDISKGIKSLGIEFDYILTSPLLRSKQTAELVSKIIMPKNPIKELDELKPEGNKLQFYNKLSNLKQDSSVLIVGHEPYLSELIGEAISHGECKIDLKKASLARIRITITLPKLKGELRWLLTPKHLKRMAR
ncbi:MAG: phosphohistidine phosphatase SixA [Thaumarchaeota archaeon]|nr:phosphohistidine phosphatase SixA [Nitrososphaerota archaeon]MDE1866909.1 phosphohistidine phosphatase SixA [Nitrososphaerota archaeon]